MHRTTEALRRTGADVALACAGVFAAARGALFVSVLVLGAWLADAASAEEKRVALIVGNSNYEFGPLKNPVNDAALMADTLRELGFWRSTPARFE
jgi:hypothetical protein